jgi:hypothetical protein
MNAAAAARAGDFGEIWAYLAGWLRVGGQTLAIQARRRQFRRARVIDDSILFDDDERAPRLLTVGNAPLLTSHVIRDVYAPLIARGLTREIPECPANRVAAG